MGVTFVFHPVLGASKSLHSILDYEGKVKQTIFPETSCTY